MILTITRHGETIENRDRICQGQLDGLLNDLGIEQAKKLASRLKDESFDIIYCSDLGRTKDTLKEIRCFHPDTPVVFVKELRERNMGELEGQKHRIDWKVAVQEERKDMRIPGGESFQELYDRVNVFVDHIRSKHSNESVLFVTHGGPIHMMLMILLGMKWAESFARIIGNTSVTIVEVDGRCVQPLLIGCTDHLDS
ncbi:histidine phosphatase family protein [Candidatus Woesearchaeota archaeon CG08_land_8_20_14_0_20_43_7]|nr:MAG: histidine phosphatase family protein [Candidatus Woesearchaeota archaeon CG08_land_8_20_14_0_20_43_7]